ncbi:hypothetical protein GBA63_07400 [Rubrobacter tropicus]|uniref:Sulfotransferase n=1 Tax=Rubrobacter tropicus TaxID=2653851 RepID=A0A6G8Q7R6_9ACTN|nr:sulfotransferase [Rubrobacter tropicus]QIN82489.1 hypothetical protein GBA63_07400 [Rubrobacter tropicus]
MDPHVFIVGCARSGTTLLQRLVDAHPDLSVTPSMHWVRDLFRERGFKRPEDPVPPTLVSALVAHPRFSRLGLDPGRVAALAGPETTHLDLLSGIFGLYGEASHKPLVGNKTAPFVRRIPELHALWPKARFVHIIRDGRDVCLSILDWESTPGAAGRYSSWGEDPISTTALWWRRKVLLGREGGAGIEPGLYRETFYESLVSDPAGECRRLCDFLGIPYEEAMLRFVERRSDPDLERAHPTMPVTAGLRDWRAQMPREAVERFEAVAGDLLEDLGYPLATSPGRATVERAARMREAFSTEAGSRGRKLPAGW